MYGYVGEIWLYRCVVGVFVCICVYICGYVGIWVRVLLQVLKAYGLVD